VLEVDVRSQCMSHMQFVQGHYVQRSVEEVGVVGNLVIPSLRTVLGK